MKVTMAGGRPERDRPGGVKRISDSRYGIGRKARESGIYRCGECGKRITLSKGRKFPPCHDGWFMTDTTTRS
ncbi:MAG TPA: hypothetical protein VMV31_05380 [Terriglobales bacterium]|nr:hypothetical protein [Terriglobales bacterium]